MQFLRTRKYYEKEFELKGRSPQDIAEENNTYPNRIRRELKRYGFTLRGRSEAQVIALKSGRREHPTEGKKRDKETKVKISETMAEHWQQVDFEERERRKGLAKLQWEEMSDEDKAAFRKSSMDAIRESSKHGSKLEHFLYNGLRQEGFDVLFHSRDILAGTQLEADLYVPAYKAVIEIDGPSHYFPIWGQENLDRNEKADKTKNNLLITYGFAVIRVKHLVKTTSEIHKRQCLNKLVQILNLLKEDFPTAENRLIEIEIL